MGNVSHYLHKRTQDYLEGLAALMGTSRSEILEDVLKYVRDEELEEDIWGEDYTEALKEVEEEAEEAGPEDLEEGEEEEEEEEAESEE